ncbi:MAG: L,D-transpeptidase [Bacteroidia bacterium]|nr:L,D-transpeptidase [Bacteroidia bacterium]
MHRVWKHILVITPIAIFIAAVGFLIFYPVPEPPVGEMEFARTSISLAAKDNAGTYSESLFYEARNYYDSAMVYWQKENGNNIYKRNYEKVRIFAGLAAKKANEASDDSENNTSSMNARLSQEIKALKETDASLTRRFSKYPLSSEIRNNISRGELLITEAELDWEKGQYMKAERKIKEAEQLLVPSYVYADANMRSYFRSYPQWKSWADTTIAESRLNQDYSIIVDKYSRKVIVYLNGEVQFSYSVELGKNWVGDKRLRGDKATPEGMYKITRMFKSDSTKYYKALLLDYPNDEDTAMFVAAIERGSLPRSAKIGGMIEIHGNGGKGSDWTAGCIALKDREMDSLFKIVKIGTPVTIIGSMYDLKHVLKR